MKTPKTQLRLQEYLEALHRAALGYVVEEREQGVKCPHCGNTCTRWTVKKVGPDRRALIYLIDRILGKPGQEGSRSRQDADARAVLEALLEG